MKRILGIDYGSKKIGIALGVGNTISPLTTVDNGENNNLRKSVVDKIAKIIEDEKIEMVVIGIPMLNGEETSNSRAVRVFADGIKKEISSSVEIAFIDESKTSIEAVRSAISYGISQKKRKEDHAFSACEILKRWMESK